VRTFVRQARAIARKELSAYFGSPVALIFVGVFLVATLASFFWVEAFFARNIADVRPLFRSMPVLMILLVGALTMRQWSEEQREGTMEVLLTLPVRRASLVMGKFAAVLALVALALGLTFFVPITVSALGNLDWGPVLGGYLAALLVAAAYAAIGLFVSSRTDNQIVSLIVTVLLCGALYAVGTPVVTHLAGSGAGEVLRAIGTGSRFESIERGVIDLRDLLYYLSLTALFLALNVVSLDGKRWSVGPHTARYRRNAVLRVVLVGANLAAMNGWLFSIHALRVDLTAGREYSLSPATRDLIGSLSEPLLMRGYISDETHPLLAPLVPAIRDMLREYEIASRGRITGEVVDPRDDEALEEEANQVYGIRPVPFRISGRYEDTVINSYFDILIRYGDQSGVLSFQDLIEVRPASGGQVEVKLRNLEYDLTRAVKKVVYGFQSLDAVFASLAEPVKLTAYVTPNTLPASLQEAPPIVDAVAQALAEEAGGKFTFETLNPNDPASGASPQTLYDTYGIQPFAVSLFSSETYYLHLLLEIGDEAQVLYLGGGVSEADLRGEIEAALKRAAPGFLKTVGLWHPSEDPVPSPYGGASPPVSTWKTVRAYLGQDYSVRQVDLASGRVPGDVDVLLVVAPQGMGEREQFAVDQYLMRGGAVIVAAGNYVLSPQQFGGGIMMTQIEDGLAGLLASYGVTVEASLVMDPQNEPFPIQVQRQVGGMSVVEIQQLSYPFFVDVRTDGMHDGSSIVANLPAVTLQWASPVVVDEGANEGREVEVLLRSTELAWLRTTLDVNPNTERYPEYGFPIEGEQASYPLAVSVRGAFDSAFRDKAAPEGASEAGTAEGGEEEAFVGTTDAFVGTTDAFVGTIDASPASARLVVIGSAEFLDDVVFDISRSTGQDRYLNNLQLVRNAVDWAVEDEDLLGIRSRGTYARLLRPLEEAQRVRWEVLNYAVALLGLIGIGVLWRMERRNEEPSIAVDARAEQGGGP
jgi:ABC-2 type transport system permease protein